jgi:hypothetical protein
VSDNPRPVDQAMLARRPDKQKVREMWGVHLTMASRNWKGPEALYLTLSGAAGTDIDQLTALGLITRPETGALSEKDAQKVVAVEKDLAAYTALREAFPGMTVYNRFIEELASGDDPTVFPGKNDKVRRALRAHVVNLDYNGPLMLSADDSGLHYPQLTLIQKLAQLHSSPLPAMNWTLLLTLNGEVRWGPRAHQPIRYYLAENIKRNATFAEQCRVHVGSAICDKLLSAPDIDFRALSVEEQRLIVAVLVPKKIASLVHTQGWVIETNANWRYGGTEGAAPMCTWAISFSWDPRSTYLADAVYEDSLATIFRSFGMLSAGGELAS